MMGKIGSSHNDGDGGGAGDNDYYSRIVIIML